MTFGNTLGDHFREAPITRFYGINLGVQFAVR